MLVIFNNFLLFQKAKREDMDKNGIANNQRPGTKGLVKNKMPTSLPRQRWGNDQL
jgi:hypothetical protein